MLAQPRSRWLSSQRLGNVLRRMIDNEDAQIHGWEEKKNVVMKPTIK